MSNTLCIYHKHFLTADLLIYLWVDVLNKTVEIIFQKKSPIVANIVCVGAGSVEV